MATESDRIKAEIERTRAELAEDVSTLADRTNPKKMAARRWDAVKDKATTVKHRVMGAASDAKETVSEKASDAADAVRSAPDAVVRQAQGSPVAVGMIAFGAGMLAAAILPETEPERRMGSQLAEHATEVMEPVREVASDIGGQVQDSARAAAQQVTQTAQDAAARTAEQVKQSGQTVRDELRN